MSLFRWILIGAGTLLMLGLFIYAHLSMAQRGRDRKDRQKLPPLDEPNLPEEFADSFSGRAEPSMGDESDSFEDSVDDGFADEEAPVSPPVPPNNQPQIIILYVVAQKGKYFTGREILTAMREHDLRYGKMKIFHKVIEIDRRKESLFGIANMVEPGIFEASSWDRLQSPGLALFLQIPAPISGVDAFDTMLETAVTLKKHFKGKILNDFREELTNEWVDAVRLRLVSHTL